MANRKPSLSDPLRKFEAHQIPMDYSDENVRHALESLSTEYKMFVEIEPLAYSCDTSKEVYRIKTEPGLGGPPFQATDLTISGSTARAVRREFYGDAAPSQKTGWREVMNKIVPNDSANRIRDAAIDLLEAKPFVFDGFSPPDAGEWTIEMCWHGRYHLFKRHYLDLPRDNEFDAFAKQLTELGHAQ